MKDLEDKFIDKIVSEKIKEIEKEKKWTVLRYWEIENVIYCKSEGEYSELRNNVYNNTNLWTCEMIISNDNIYYIKKDPYKILWLKHPTPGDLFGNIFIQSVLEQYIKWWIESVNFRTKRICESCWNILKLEKDENQFVLYFLWNDIKVYINNSFNAGNVYQSLIKLVPKEVIENNKNIDSNLNNDIQEFLWRINNFQDKCYRKIDAMKKEFNLEHPIIESNTNSSKLFMANWAIIDSENTIKEWHKLLEEFNNFDLNDNGINQCFWFFKLTLECLEETYEKVKMKYGPAISTYKTLRKITSKNAVYKPSEINYDDTANTENNVKAQDNKKDDSDENSTLTTEIWVILIIIWIIILIALNS